MSKTTSEKTEAKSEKTKTAETKAAKSTKSAETKTAKTKTAKSIKQAKSKESATRSPNLNVITDMGVLELRLKLDDKKGLAAVKKGLGLALPTTPWTLESNGKMTAHCIGIDRFMVYGDAQELETIAQDLSAKGIMAISQSDAYQMIQLSGTDLRSLVARLAPINIFEDRFEKPFCRWLNLEDFHVLLSSETWPTEVSLLVQRSFCDYFVDFLTPLMHSDTELSLFNDVDVAI